MKFISKYGVLFLICLTFWIILNTSFNIFTLLTGILISIITIIIVHSLFSGEYYAVRYRFPLIALIKYAFILFINIYLSALKTIINIFTKNVNPTFININTNIKNEWFKCLIANSITMTPGTVSVALHDDNQLTVLWLNPTTLSNKAAGDIIKGSFENILLKVDEK